MLEALKFPSIFTKWVMECITSVHFQVNINGKDSKKFAGERGLRQGDLPSPLLFVITMEALSRMLNETSSMEGFKFHPGCKNLGLTHLMFADDLMMFSKADVTSIRMLLATMNQFHNIAGLKSNKAKSQMVLGGVIMRFA